MKKLFVCALALFITAMATAQLKREGNRFFFNKVIIEFCTSSLFRVKSTLADNEPWMVVQYQFQPVTVTATQTATGYQLTTSQLKLKINKSPFTIEVYNAKGELLSADKSGIYKKGDTVGCEKKLPADEHFFGFGERMDFLDRRNKQLTLNVGRGKGLPHIIGAYNILEANYSPVPFFMSTKGYGIFFHNAYPTTWDMGASNANTYRFSAAGGELDYYFMYGPSFPMILEQYTTLTGKSPLLPQSALGLHVGTYSGGTWGHEEKTSDQYVIELARKLRQMGIPADLLWLDSTLAHLW